MPVFGKSSNKYNSESRQEIIDKAFRCHSEGKLRDAEKLYKLFIEKGFKDSAVFNNYAVICKKFGRIQESKNLYKKSIALFDNNPDAFSNLAIIYKDLGKIEDAIIYTKRAVELQPENPIFNYNLANLFHEHGMNDQAEYFMKQSIHLNPDFFSAYNNLGNIFLTLGRLVEAKSLFKKVISLNPKFAPAYSNLGVVLRDLRDPKGARSNFIKAIELDNNLCQTYYYLSTLKSSAVDDKKWIDLLFSKDLDNLSPKNLVDLSFAKANIYHQSSQFKKSSEMLVKANNLNSLIHPSDYQETLDNIDKFSNIWRNKKVILPSRSVSHKPIPIFIVGLPRSGKSIIESILSSNESIYIAGENMFFSKAVNMFLSEKNVLSLHQLYINNLGADVIGKNFVSNTTPINYMYTGLILSQIKNSKIIYCHRNLLDNIYEMYAKNLVEKYTFKNSILDSVKMSMKIKSLMESYKEEFQKDIYFIDYDQLVSNPKTEISNLVSWLGWDIGEEYFNPLLHPSTNQNLNDNDSILNTNHINKWAAYRKMLKPAIDYINVYN